MIAAGVSRLGSVGFEKPKIIVLKDADRSTMRLALVA